MANENKVMIERHSDAQENAESTPSEEILGKAYDLLQQLLDENGGIVSSIQLKRELVSKSSLAEAMAAQCIKELQFLDSDADARVGRKKVRIFHRGRSFFSEKKYEEAKIETDEEAAATEKEAEKAEEPQETEKESPQNRKDEARLGVYVKEALDTIYDSDHASEESPYVFDVHRERPGSAFENVDLMAVHWRSESTVDLVSVEVKLEFSAKAVHQACSYTRFSHRVWVACLVGSEATDAALELRSKDPGLFDYAVARGIGILGCRRTQGRSYQVFPIHWPAWHDPEPVEKDRFVDRYRECFEKAGVVEKKKRTAKF